MREFGEANASARKPLSAWREIAKRGRWVGPKDVKEVFAAASILGATRVVFNIGGNSYRLVVAVRWGGLKSKGILFVRFIGTHAEYDKINALEV